MDHELYGPPTAVASPPSAIPFETVPDPVVAEPAEGPADGRFVGAACGLIATGFGLGIGWLVAGIWKEADRPERVVGQSIIDNAPIAVKDWAIRTFGTHDKLALEIGTAVILLLLGVLAGARGARGRWTTAALVLAGVAAIGSAAVLDRPNPTIIKLLPALLGTGGAWLALRRMLSRATPATTRTAQPMGLGRRTVLTRGLAFGSLGAIGFGLGDVLRRRFAVDEDRRALASELDGGSAVIDQPITPQAILGADLDVSNLTPFVVPQRDFYRIDTALSVPQVARAEWSLRIHGMVDREITLTYDDLLARPQIERYVTLSCVSNEVGGDLIGNALWRGVLLKDILEEAGVQPGVEQVASRSIDGWTCGTPIEALIDGRDSMLAIAINNEPLTPEHGYPVRMVVPGLYGYVSATKWVVDIELTTWDAFDVYWIPRGWAKQGPIKVQSRIDTITRRDAASSVVVGGVAWCVHRGIEQVEVRIDEGEWRPVTQLGTVPSVDTWRLWKYEWSDATPGDHVVQVRAITSDGETQTGEPADVAPDGAQGWHRVRTTIPG